MPIPVFKSKVLRIMKLRNCARAQWEKYCGVNEPIVSWETSKSSHWREDQSSPWVWLAILYQSTCVLSSHSRSTTRSINFLIQSKKPDQNTLVNVLYWVSRPCGWYFYLFLNQIWITFNITHLLLAPFSSFSCYACPVSRDPLRNSSSLPCNVSYYFYLLYF